MTSSAPSGSTSSIGRSSSTPTRATSTSFSGSITTTRRWPGRRTGPSRSTPARGRCRSSASRRSSGVRRGRGRAAAGTPRGDRRRRAAVVRRARHPASGREGDPVVPRGCSPWAKHLPSEAAEALFWLAEGDSPEVVRGYLDGSASPAESGATSAVSGSGFQLVARKDLVQQRIGKPAIQRVDTNDLSAALEHPDSRRRFVTIHTDEELNSILDAPLEKWRVFLHPSQERLVAKSFNGPARVTGGAGTGKTVVAMHRARHLARTLCASPQDKILFTTYTANLAQRRRPEPRPPLRPRGEPDRGGPPARLGRSVPARSGPEVRGRQSVRAGYLLGGGDPDLGRARVRPRLLAPGVGAGHPGERDPDRRRLPQGAPDRAGTDAEPGPASAGLEGLRAVRRGPPPARQGRVERRSSETPGACWN